MNRRVAYIRFTCDVLLLLGFLFAGYEAQGFQERTRWFPVFVCGLGALLVAVQLVYDIVVYRRGGSLMGGGIEYGPPPAVAHVAEASEVPTGDVLVRESEEDDGRSAFYSWGAIAAFVALIAVFGAVVAIAVWLSSMLYFLAKTKLWFAAVTTIAALALLLFLQDFIQLDLPQGLIGALSFT